MKRETVSADFTQASAFLADVNVWPCKITISDDAKTRSLPQNSLFWMWMSQLSKFLVAGGRADCTSDFCHDLMCNTFNGCEDYCVTNAKTGEKRYLTRVIGTSGLKKGEFTHLLDLIYHLCLDWGLTLTIPHDCEYKNLMEQQSK
jgi:hypothetical protein